MAFSKSRLSGEQQGKSLVEASIQPATSAGYVVKTGRFDQSQDNIMEGDLNPSCNAFCLAGGVFPQDHFARRSCKAVSIRLSFRLICLACLDEAFWRDRLVRPYPTVWLVLSTCH